ncbi:P2Y purinoceptor 8 [Gadus morhua]|uniref:P2Y receptor family member 8 n=1 Tax=Gadus morhua TaxID=8049 RepID=A0A8C4ZRZ0_GADMO|nr:P2Y purinoceptor 8 [Gadus morhua]XP_030199088.1 P2Y purinoceptor 8 [Gadus morhua]
MSPSANFTKLDNATLNLFQNYPASLTISIIYTVVTVVNLGGNGLSMWLLLFRTSPKTPSIIFMINLTLTDLSLGAALPFQIAYQLRGYNWTLGPGMCRFMTIAFFSNMYCSILTMTAIGVDRYLGILWPIRFREIRARKSIAVLACLLMWAVVLTVLYPLMTTDLTFHIPELGITTCFDVLKRDLLPSFAAWLVFIFSMLCVLFFLPFCITVYCYVSVIRKLAQDSKTVQKDRAMRLTATVLLVFVICFAPNNVLLLAHTVLRFFYNDSLYMAYKLSLCLSCFNSCLDPFIYYFASKEFRHKLRQMLRLRSLSTSDIGRGTEHKESLFSAHQASDAQQTNTRGL